LDDHSLLSLAAAGVSIALASDAQSVMKTELAREHQRARMVLGEFRGDASRERAGEGRIRVAKAVYELALGTTDSPPPYELSYAELPSTMRNNIDTAYERMIGTAANKHVDIIESDGRDHRRSGKRLR